MGSEGTYIDIESKLALLSERELRRLNKSVVARIKMIVATRREHARAQFRIGDHVSFDHNDITYFGYVLRINTKTITVDTELDGEWLVAPTSLNRLIPVDDL